MPALGEAVMSATITASADSIEGKLKSISIPIASSTQDAMNILQGGEPLPGRKHGYRDFDTMSQLSGITRSTGSNYSNTSSYVSSRSRRISPGKISERLQEPTAAIVYSQQKLKEMKENPPDDIWGTNLHTTKYEHIIQRSQEKYDYVPSKLLESTTSYEHWKFEKHEIETIKLSKPIDPNSRILAPTESYLKSFRSTAPSDIDDTASSAQLSGLGSSLSNGSRLLEPTQSAWNKTRKAQEILEAEMTSRQEEELAALKASQPKVSKTPERILQGTKSSDNNKHPKLLPIPEDVPAEPVNVKKVSGTSARVLEFNSAAENRKWKGSPRNASPVWTLKDGSAPPPERLLEPTQAYERGKYRKSDAEPDNRELGWKSYFTKSGKIVIPGNEKKSDVPLRQPLKKVQETSSRLLTPTAANEAYKNSWQRASTPGNYGAKQHSPVSSRPSSAGRYADDLRSLQSPRYKHTGTKPRFDSDELTLNLSTLPQRRKGSFSSTISTNTAGTDWNSPLDLLEYTCSKQEAIGLLETNDEEENIQPPMEEESNDVHGSNESSVEVPLHGDNHTIEVSQALNADATEEITRAFPPSEEKENVNVSMVENQQVVIVNWSLAEPEIIESRQPFETDTSYDDGEPLECRQESVESFDSGGTPSVSSRRGSGSNRNAIYTTFANISLQYPKSGSISSISSSEKGSAKSPWQKSGTSSTQSSPRNGESVNWSDSLPKLRPVGRPSFRTIPTSSDPPAPEKYLVKESRLGSVRDLVKVFSKDSDSPRK